MEAALSDGRYFRDADNRCASSALMPAVYKLLSEAGTTLRALDFIACVTGPGSFTGIRIGVSTVRALCYALGKPALSVHYLQMLAYNERADGYGKILCISDASNGTAYICEYDANRMPLGKCMCVLQEEAVRQALTFDGAVCVDERMARLVPQAFVPAENCRALIRAATSLADKATDYKLLLPVYIRESQAEKDLKARESRA